MDKDTLLLRKDGCCWLGPEYDPQKHYGPTPYCGRHDLHGDSLYCEEHYPKMYNKGSAVRKRPKKARKRVEFDQLLQEIIDIHEELYG